MTIKLAVLASTKGTDSQAVIDAIETGKLDAEIVAVIANKEDCYALERARKHNLNAVFLDPKGKEREEYDREIDKILEDKGVELILLIGYMKLMSSWFVQKYENRIMNVHPSLLPAYAGGMDLNVHEAALERGCRITGASLIFVDEGADTGPIIGQKAVEIKDDDTVDTLKSKVQKLEQEMLLEAISLFAQGKLRVEGKRVFVEK